MDAQNISKAETGIKVPAALWPRIERAALLYFLIADCLSLTKDSLRDVQRHFKYSTAEVENYQIRSVPSRPANIVIAGECLKKFGPARLLASGLFYSFSREGSICTCEDWSNTSECAREAWLLDVDGSIYPRGLLLPIRDSRGWYSDLLCFRNVQDKKPFVLKVRAEQEVAA